MNKEELNIILEKQKGQITCLRIENANILGEPFLPNNDKPKIVEFLKLDENDIIDLINFAKIFTKNSIVHSNDMWIGKIYFDRQVCGDEKFDLIKKVVEKYGK